ncbi:hypothetical protein Ga0074812_10316 [Parafrankia irregularis]|uniref:Uncharacterized protein n=1 Tax=Parafrankia irregularis TaxID=795642 RepID=A0A0S4QH30_9ACTN|nr:hypothetical protein Ga0074812_10316 [Parafrankia irregularis]
METGSKPNRFRCWAEVSHNGDRRDGPAAAAIRSHGSDHTVSDQAVAVVPERQLATNLVSSSTRSERASTARLMIRIRCS